MTLFFWYLTADGFAVGSQKAVATQLFLEEVEIEQDEKDGGGHNHSEKQGTLKESWEDKTTHYRISHERTNESPLAHVIFFSQIASQIFF